jgi:peptidoglycan-associated lipoprotein
MLVKRLIVLMLAIGLVAFVAGCGGKEAMDEPVVDTPEPPPPAPEEPPVVEEPEEPKEVEMAPALNDVFFAFDKYNLTSESKSILEGNADELKRVSSARITIEGHCDERGTKSYNLALGEKRANAAKDYLVALGVNGSRITVVSYGKERPFVMGHDEAAWAKNRRAHFVLKK